MGPQEPQLELLTEDIKMLSDRKYLPRAPSQPWDDPDLKGRSFLLHTSEADRVMLTVPRVPLCFWTLICLLHGHWELVSSPGLSWVVWYKAQPTLGVCSSAVPLPTGAAASGLSTGWEGRKEEDQGQTSPKAGLHTLQAERQAFLLA